MESKRVIPFCSHKSTTAKKESGNANHRFFSNWSTSPFVLDNVHYNSTEQYMMHQKALLFNDPIVVKKVMDLNYSPSEPDDEWNKQMKDIKALGREVANFKPEVWNAQCEEIMKKGIHAKFSQNELLKETLLATGNDIICEAASYDKIWGIGMSYNDPRVQDPEQWQGKNLLGKCLMAVRDELQKTC